MRAAKLLSSEDPLAAFLDADLYRRRDVHEFTAPAWGPGTFHLVQGPQAALQLEASGVPAGRILCACLVLDWRLAGLSVVAQAEAARNRLSAGARVPCAVKVSA